MGVTLLHELCASSVQSHVITRGCFVQWFKAFVSPVYQEPLCMSLYVPPIPLKLFFTPLLPHSSFNSNSLPLPDSSPPYSFWLVTFSLRQLASLCTPHPPTLPTTSSSTAGPPKHSPFVSCCPPLPNHVWYFFIFFPFHVHGVFFARSHICILHIFHLPAAMTWDTSWSLPLLVIFHPVPTRSSFPPTCTFSPSLISFYIHPSCEWVTWICLFALEPLSSAVQGTPSKNQ